MTGIRNVEKWQLPNAIVRLKRLVLTVQSPEGRYVALGKLAHARDLADVGSSQFRAPDYWLFEAVFAFVGCPPFWFGACTRIVEGSTVTAG